jgi:hypothetical protein
MTEEVTGGSGSGPQRALEANNKSPRAQRETLTLPRASLRAQDLIREALPKTRPPDYDPERSVPSEFREAPGRSKAQAF